MPGMPNSIPVLGTEPASENRIRSCYGSAPGIRFYCKPVTLVRCREIRGEYCFSGRVGGKWLWDMISAFIINELRGAWALRLFCGRSSFPPPTRNPVLHGRVSCLVERRGSSIARRLHQLETRFYSRVSCLVERRGSSIARRLHHLETRSCSRVSRLVERRGSSIARRLHQLETRSHNLHSSTGRQAEAGKGRWQVNCSVLDTDTRNPHTRMGFE